MNERRIAMLVMKVFGLYVMFRGISDTLHGLESVYRDVRFFGGSGVVSGVILVVLGAAIWFNADFFAERALGERFDGDEEDADEDRESSELTLGLGHISALDVHSIALSVLGVFFV